LFAFSALLPGEISSQTQPTVSVDAVTTGNTPRSVASLDNCVSTEPGGELAIDIVVSDPGLGAAGLSGYEFRLYFDPDVVWVQSEDPHQLLSQAPGSSLFPVSGPFPNYSGEHLSIAVDFGSGDIEPTGSSESSGGVLSRITLLAKSRGESNLRLQRVSLVDDASEKVTPAIAGPSRILVGSTCELAATTSATPAPVGGAETPQAPTESPSPVAIVVPSPGSPGTVPSGGGPPSSSESSWHLTSAGALITALGTAILSAVEVARRLQRPSRNRR
jgi:hypothetical protein